MSFNTRFMRRLSCAFLGQGECAESSAERVVFRGLVVAVESGCLLPGVRSCMLADVW